MLAYYVQWRMIEAWRPLLFADEDQEAKKDRDPVAAAVRSDAALQRQSRSRLRDCNIVATPNEKQRRAFELLKTITVQAEPCTPFSDIVAKLRWN